MYRSKESMAFGALLVLIAIFVGLIIAALWAWPKYKVYKLEMNGIASLKEAEWSKKILVEEAKAREEAALMQAKARVTLAEAEGKAKIVAANSPHTLNRDQKNRKYVKGSQNITTTVLINKNQLTILSTYNIATVAARRNIPRPVKRLTQTSCF